MPNWCYTNYCFTGAPEVLLEFQTLIENSSDDHLGSVLKAFKIDETKISCRGEIVCNNIQKKGLFIETITAWAPAMEMWDIIINKYFTKEGEPEISYVYMAEEPGMGYYINTDTSGEIFPYIYKLYAGNSARMYSECQKKYLVEDLNLLLAEKELSILNIDKTINSEHFDNILSAAVYLYSQIADEFIDFAIYQHN